MFNHVITYPQRGTEEHLVCGHASSMKAHKLQSSQTAMRRVYNPIENINAVEVGAITSAPCPCLYSPSHLGVRLPTSGTFGDRLWARTETSIFLSTASATEIVTAS